MSKEIEWGVDDPLYNLQGEIEKLYFDRDLKIKAEKDRPVAMPFIEGRIKNIIEEYQGKIEQLERRRKYIIELKNVKNNKRGESFLSKFFWQVIVVLIVGILLALILKKFFGI